MQFEAENRYLAIEFNDNGFHQKEIIRKKDIVKIYVSQTYKEELIIETRIPDKPYKTLFMKIKNKREKSLNFTTNSKKSQDVTIYMLYNDCKNISDCFEQIREILEHMVSKISDEEIKEIRNKYKGENI